MSDSMDLRGYAEGLAHGELRLQRCSACDRSQWPPRPVCAGCGSKTLDWQRCPEVGEVFTWTVIGHTRLPAFVDLTPYAVAVLEVPGLDVRLVGRMDGPPDAVGFGARCRWHICDGPDGSPVPVWTLEETV